MVYHISRSGVEVVVAKASCFRERVERGVQRRRANPYNQDITEGIASISSGNNWGFEYHSRCHAQCGQLFPPRRPVQWIVRMRRRRRDQNNIFVRTGAMRVVCPNFTPGIYQQECARSGFNIISHGDLAVPSGAHVQVFKLVARVAVKDQKNKIYVFVSGMES